MFLLRNQLFSVNPTWIKKNSTFSPSFNHNWIPKGNISSNWCLCVKSIMFLSVMNFYYLPLFIMHVLFSMHVPYGAVHAKIIVEYKKWQNECIKVDKIYRQLWQRKRNQGMSLEMVWTCTQKQPLRDILKRYKFKKLGAQRVQQRLGKK